MNDIAWNAIIAAAVVFGTGVGVAWAFWNQIGAKFDALTKMVKEEISAVSTAIERRIDDFESRDRKEHAEMLNLITQVRIEAAENRLKPTASKRSRK